MGVVLRGAFEMFVVTAFASFAFIRVAYMDVAKGREQDAEACLRG